MRDLLDSEAHKKIGDEIEGVDQRIRRVQTVEDVIQVHGSLSSIEQQIKFPLSRGSLSATIDLILVVLVLALGVRTFFFHPMQIPTGSMEPTFMGERSRFLSDSEVSEIQGVIPGLFSRCLFGKQSIHIQALKSGVLEIIDPTPRSIASVLKWQRFSIDGMIHTVWFPPKNLWGKAGLKSGMVFAVGDDVIRLLVEAGDFLLVNRWGVNFRRAVRGEAVVFSTDLVDQNPHNQFYLKRLVGNGEELVRIGDDRLVRIDDRLMDSTHRGFEKVTFSSETPRDGSYSGYLNGAVARRYQLVDSAPLFPTETSSLMVRPRHVFVLGDNTVNSLDSRTWGDFPQEAIIGRPSVVLWPFTERFGLADF